jgi:hypothetical protein
MTNLDEWTMVDLYVEDPKIKKWDATTLEAVGDKTCECIYASHLLEHISHTRILEVLKLWKDKLCEGGQLILNVPDLLWASRQVVKYENDQIPDSGVYTSFEGNTGLQSIFYGTHYHEGEYHKAGFTRKSLTELLEKADFKNIQVTEFYEAHDMGCLLSTCNK